MATTPTPAPRLRYDAWKCEVRLGGELVATARSPNMARRIAYALNLTRDSFTQKRNPKPNAKP
jgi:hypothetical protein